MAYILLHSLVRLRYEPVDDHFLADEWLEIFGVPGDGLELFHLCAGLPAEE